MPHRNAPAEAVLREVRYEGGVLRLDLCPQVLSVEAAEHWSDPAEEPLAPTPPADPGGFVSAATLLFKAKQVDDGLLAAVELAARQGVGRLPGRDPWLRSVLQRLLEAASPDPEAVAAVAGAAAVGGDPQHLPDALRPVTERSVERFLASPLRSRPLGFYSWSDPLRETFRQTRLLQTPLPPGPAAALAGAVGSDPDVRAAYLTLLRLAAGLTNPPDRPTLLDTTRGHDRSILPAARSHEVTLVERLFPESPPPEGFDLMAELVRRVRAGKLSLRPTADSGWYDHVTWSLAPLLEPNDTPEGGRIRPGPRYRLMLEDLFKGSLALARETHAARLRLGGIKGIDETVVDVYSALTVEPLPEVYRRRAAAYRFVRGVLDGAFGADAVAGLRRLTPDGPTSASLADELASAERLFEGAYRVACREIGHPEEPARWTIRATWATTSDFAFPFCGAKPASFSAMNLPPGGPERMALFSGWLYTRSRYTGLKWCGGHRSTAWPPKRVLDANRTDWIAVGAVTRREVRREKGTVSRTGIIYTRTTPKLVLNSLPVFWLRATCV
ncbi:MAG: hypothetical protein LC104_11845 [Bacteroidales bacterium]|nr:hypothetical protein [Bacteroidales bacterium]